ncbi:MAG: hypothetical protein GX907_04665 [Clostridiaceae bacterium]|nr:hypothetical protein [Clostridiaceae bacterium]
MIALINATIVLPDHYIRDGVLLMQDGRIVDFGEQNKVVVPSGAEVIDARGAYVGPGLIDIHTHAGGAHYFHENPQAAAEHHLKSGTTSLLPALAYWMNEAEYLTAISLIRAEMGHGSGRTIRGLYMEGPFLNPKYGAERENLPWPEVVAPGQYERLVAAAGSLAKVWCVAPERRGVEGFVRYIHERYPEALFSVAHSEAEPWQIELFIPLGLRLATHHTNATGTIQRYPECRGVCVDETVNYNDDITAEIISDSRGIHVDPYMQRLIRKIKGRDRLILISDATAHGGPVPKEGDYAGVTDLNFDYAGEIAGSKLTLSAACGNFIKHTGAGLCDAFCHASRNPARLLGWTDRGEIRRGAVADLVIVDAFMTVQQVFLDGEPLERIARN